MMKRNFNELCRIIVETNGNPSTKQVEKCGYSFEAFLRISQCNKEKLVEECNKVIDNIKA